MKSLMSFICSCFMLLALAGVAIAGETVNINTADATTLDRILVNVGPVKAQAIVDYRKANGAFRSPEQLAMVKGIGLRTVEMNRDRISVSSARQVMKPVTQQAPQQVARR